MANYSSYFYALALAAFAAVIYEFVLLPAVFRLFGGEVRKTKRQPKRPVVEARLSPQTSIGI
jgi:hypothetical protein